MIPLKTCIKFLQRRIPSQARLAYLSSRVFYELMPVGVRTRIVARFGGEWPFFCPVCDDRLTGFSPLPEFYLEELKEHGSDLNITDFETCNFQAYQCSHCGATDRDRLYALYLADRLPSGEAQQAAFSLLDIAPASALSRHIKRHYQLRYRTADLFQKNVDDRVDVTAMDCYPDGIFDAFICSHVLEHVEDDRKAMAELWRVLKPGGWGLAMVPIARPLQEPREDPTKTTPRERWKHFGQGDHVRLYSRDGFVRRLQEAGFTVHLLNRDYFKIERMARCGLSTSSVLYVVEKPSCSPALTETARGQGHE